MPATDIAASTPDIAAIVTSLGVFSLAVAAVVGGIYRGLKQVKSGTDADKAVAGAILMDTLSVRMLTESNTRLAETNSEIVNMLREIRVSTQQLNEAIKEQREVVRSQIDEQHRLRVAAVDLTDQIRRSLR